MLGGGVLGGVTAHQRSIGHIALSIPSKVLTRLIKNNNHAYITKTYQIRD